MHIAMTEATCDEHVRRSRGWKLFLLLPRMLLSRKPRGGSISREALQTRFRQFAEGLWEPLIQYARDASEVASDVMVRRRRRRARDDTERRAARAQVFVQMGELSSGRAALEAGGSCSRFGRHVAAVAESNPEATSTKGTNSSAFVGARSARSV